MTDWQTLSKLLEEGQKCLVLTITNVKGSAPREAGASMIITQGGTQFGTIGGGALEWQGTKQAHLLLAENATYMKQHHQLILGPDLEQCCGGVVDLSFELFTQKEKLQVCQRAESLSHETQWQNLVIFGAGHIGKALIKSIADQAFSVQWVDSRSSMFDDTSPQNVAKDNVTICQTDQPVQVLDDLSQDTFVLIMTHCHKLDFQLVSAALQNNNVCFTGLIGSATKKARFVKRLADNGLTLDQISDLVCPIGINGISSKTPQAIAASVTAQLLIEAELVITARNRQKQRAFGGESRFTIVGGN